LTYLQRFDRLFEISKDRKSADYRQYLYEHLFPYLLDFLKRCKPLINIEKDLTHVRQEFEIKWEQGTFPGWPVDFRFEFALNSRFVFRKKPVAR